MKRFIALCLALFLLLSGVSALGEEPLDEIQVLSSAFACLEEGNPFLTRYNTVTWAEVVPRLPQGVPYVWGGMTASHVFAKEPDYCVLPISKGSPVWYEAGRKYINGFDCIGFIRYVYERARRIKLTTISGLFAEKDLFLWSSRTEDTLPLRMQWTELDPGDLLVMEHPGRHIAMYVGTLRNYGYTEGELGEQLAAYIDYPLVIHSSVNAQVSNRFADLIRNGLPKYKAATDTDGGVCVSLITPHRDSAPYTVNQQKQDTSYFVLPDGTWLTVLPYDEMTRFAWIRVPDGYEFPEPDPEPANP